MKFNHFYSLPQYTFAPYYLIFSFFAWRSRSTDSRTPPNNTFFAQWRPSKYCNYVNSDMQWVAHWNEIASHHIVTTH